MLRFPSDEWIKTFKDELNKTRPIRRSLPDWEGDFLFVITPDEELKKETVFYIDLWHGKCRDAYLVKGEKQAKFVFKGPYSNWKKVIRKELDPIRGLIRGMFTVDGESRVILDQAKAAQELVKHRKYDPGCILKGLTMGHVLDCFFWDPAIRFNQKIQIVSEDIGNGITLKKPIFTTEALEKIIIHIKNVQKEYVRTHDIPAVLETIDTVNALWMDPTYKGRKIAREVLPTVTGFSVEMIESWGFDYFFDIIKKENLPLAGKLQPNHFREFSACGDGLVKVYGKPHVTHSNYSPEVIGHICAGNILGLAAFEMVMDKLVDAATWVKVPTEEPVFGALYAKSIEEIDPLLAHSIAVLPFSSQDTLVQDYPFSQSDLVSGDPGGTGATDADGAC